MKTILLFTCLLFLSCQAENKKPATPAIDEQFQTFLNQFPKKDLPLEIVGCAIAFKTLSELKKEISLPYEKNLYYVYSVIPSKGDYISTITLAAADCFIPILTTYKLSGEKIDSKAIATNNCNDGPCSDCKQTVVIDKDSSIKIINYFNYFDCDENGNIKSDQVTKREVAEEVKLTAEGAILIGN